MLDLRTLCVAMALVCGPDTLLAQSASQLANIDSQLNALCARLQGAAGDDASAIRARLSRCRASEPPIWTRCRRRSARSNCNARAYRRSA